MTPAASASERTDTERLDWLEAHPQSVEMHGADADRGLHYGLVAHRSVSLRDAIDALMHSSASEAAMDRELRNALCRRRAP